MPNFEYENKHYDEGYSAVCGCDEAGRGPLCGPVVAAAVILPRDVEIEGLNDSKKLTEKKREALFEVIKEKAVAYAIAECTPAEKDEYNILNASMLAMRRAVEMLKVKADFALIDGNCSRGFTIPTETVVNGDAKSASIAAASIIAKVTRDRLMEQYEEVLPGYGFASNKGYGSAMHIQAIKELGDTPIHRKSFIKNFI